MGGEKKLYTASDLLSCSDNSIIVILSPHCVRDEALGLELVENLYGDIICQFRSTGRHRASTLGMKVVWEVEPVTSIRLLDQAATVEANQLKSLVLGGFTLSSGSQEVWVTFTRTNKIFYFGKFGKQSWLTNTWTASQSVYSIAPLGSLLFIL